MVSSALPFRFSSSIPEWLHAAALIGLAIVTGIVGWSGHVLTLPVALVFPALWASSRSRLVAAAVSAGYFLAASRGLPQGVANFYAADLWPGLLLWVAASLSFLVVHTALWTKRRGEGTAVRFFVAAVLMALPPFGIVGWAHPITAAGVVFPGWGWLGLVAAAAGLLVMTTKWWPAASIALGGFWLWSAATWTPPPLPYGWTGVDLELGQSLGRDVALDRHRDLVATVKRTASQGAGVVVLPESTLGFWTPTVDRLWRGGLNGTTITVIAGGVIVGSDGYDNAMIAVSAPGSQILYRERMPVPVSMWQPWRRWIGESAGARAHLFANPVVELAGSRIAPLICYEQLIVWPVLQSMVHDPDLVVATGNGWWTAGTSIVAIQIASAEAWAKLFGKPIVMAFNT